MKNEYTTHLRLLEIAAICILAASTANAQDISLKTGESADLGAAYWINNCRSLLNSFAGVDVLDGPPGIVLSIREEDVYARRQNCPEKVRGGVIVVTARDVPLRSSSVLKYRVRYNTSDGQRQSTHSVAINLYP